MNKLIRKIPVVICLAMMLLVIGSTLGVRAEAKTKKAEPVSPEEQTVTDLTRYIEALVLTGADQATIDAANKALENAVAAVEAQKALAAQQEAAKAQQAAYEAELKKQQAEAEKIWKKMNKGQKFDPNVFPFIFVGDSRTVQMHDVVGDTGVSFIAENSRGYDWFAEKAIPRIDPHVGKGTKIVINLGVNDPGNIDKYIALVNQKSVEWTAKGAKVYYATVYPVTDNPYTTEEQVKMFNQKLATGLQGVQIIDTYTWLKSVGYQMVDGLHYSSGSTANIYAYLIQNIM